jgi:molybdate transport system regulatory protein
MSDFRVRSKIWLEWNGQPFLGDGRYRLLVAVAAAGSINAAAKQLGISYRAWSQLEAMEQHAPYPLLERRSGDKGGGETRLTDAALNLLRYFGDLRDQVNRAVDAGFKERFERS